MENHRQFFRIRFFEEPLILEKEAGVYEGVIRDLSGNGVSFYLHEDIEFEECVLHFTLKNEKYTLTAQKVRKEKGENGEYVYACTFVGANEKTQSAIVSELLKLDAIRRKK